MSENITFKQWVSKAGNKTAGFVSNFADHRSAATHLQSLITSGEFDDEFTADVCKSVLKKGDKAPEFALFFCHHKATFGNGFAKKWAKRDAANDDVSASVGNCLALAKFMFSEFAERRIWKDTARTPALEVPVQIGEGDPHILRVTILTKSTVPENNGNLSLSLRTPDFTWDTKDTTDTWQGTIVANPDHADPIGKFNPRDCHPDVQALLTAITNDPQILSGWTEFFNRRSVDRNQQSFSHPLFGGGSEPHENVAPVASTPVDIKTLRSHARFH